MGFFDRFRRDKKEETKVEQKQPLRIEYEDYHTKMKKGIGLTVLSSIIEN